MATQADYDDLSARVTKLGPVNGTQALILLRAAADTERSAQAAAITADGWFTTISGDSTRTNHAAEIATGIADAQAAPDATFDHARLVHLTTEAMADAVAVDEAAQTLTVDLYAAWLEPIANIATLGLIPSSTLGDIEKAAGGTGGGFSSIADAFSPGAGGIPGPGGKWLTDLWAQLKKYITWIAVGLGVLVVGSVVLIIITR